MTLPLWDPGYMTEFVQTFLYPVVAYLKLFTKDQLNELLPYQILPLFRDNRILSQIGRELNGTFDSVEGVLEKILFNKGCQHDNRLLNDILMANIELGHRYFKEKEDADKIRVDKTHLLLEVVKQKDDAQKRLALMIIQRDLLNVQIEAQTKALRIYEESEKRMTVQIATCHSSIQELIKPTEREVGSMIDMCKGIAESFVNAESMEEKQALYETF